MTIGEKIARVRRAGGLTQEELADRLGVTRQSVSKWESDAALPETEKIVRLCGLLHISCDDLLRGDAVLPFAADGTVDIVCGDAVKGQLGAGTEARAVCGAAEKSSDGGEIGGNVAKAASRRHLSGGERAFVLFCIIVGGFLALVSVSLFFALPNMLDDIFGELAVFFGVGSAFVVLGVVVGLFLRRR